jgi:hypothetical protein
MRITRRPAASLSAALLFLTGAIMSLALLAEAAGAASSLYDKPVKMLRVKLPPDPENPQARARVSCFYFARFMVKEVDLGEVGAEQLSILPLAGGPETAPCQRENAAAERVIDPRDWSGYFDGVKGDYVFFSADDGWNDGVGFAVFGAGDGKKLFEDVARKGFHAITTIPAGLSLRYERVYGASCSLAEDKAGCWEKIRAETGLAGAPPDCLKAYQREQERVPKFAAETLKDPTIIDYEAAVVLEGGAKNVTPVSGKALRCRPAE